MNIRTPSSSSTTTSLPSLSANVITNTNTTANNNTAILNTFAQINTSKQWTTLSAFINKFNKKIKKKKHLKALTTREAGYILLSTDPNVLKTFGIWITSFGKKFMPIVITNPAHYRYYQQQNNMKNINNKNRNGNRNTTTNNCNNNNARKKNHHQLLLNENHNNDNNHTNRNTKNVINGDNNNFITCTCAGKKPSSSTQQQHDQNRKFYESHDYNAGRHFSTQSQHKANCLLWSPPTSGHLHSWRRGYEDDGKK